MSVVPPPRAVRWSPHYDDQALIAGSGIRLFEVRDTFFSCDIDNAENNLPTPSGTSSPKHVSSEPSSPKPSMNPSSLKLLAVNCSDKLVRSTVFDWYPDGSYGNYIAMGHRTGTAVVTRVETASDVSSGIGSRRELSPRQNRPCSLIKWNPVGTSQLAVGLEKSSKSGKGEACILVWDVSAKSLSMMDTLQTAKPQRSQQSRSMKASPYGAARTSGALEYAHGEPVHSLEWWPQSADVLFAGIGQRLLRRYDTREQRSGTDVSKPKGTHCLTIDPNQRTTFATYSKAENQIKIWDMRHYDHPMATIATPRNSVTQLSWSPTRRGLLGALFDSSSVVQIYDTHLLSSNENNDSTSDAVSEADAKAFIAARQSPKMHDTAIVNFDWHPNERNKIMTVTEKGTISVCKLTEPVTADLSPRGQLVYGQSTRHIPRNLNFKDGRKKASDDISMRIYERAIKGAGIEAESNMTAYKNEEETVDLWLWIDHISTARAWAHGGNSEKGSTGRMKPEAAILGVRDALNFTGTSFMGHNGTFSGNGKLDIATYESTLQRFLAVRLCGWAGISENDDMLNEKLYVMESKQEFERAAAISIFHQNIGRAVRSLAEGAKLEGQDRSGMLSAAMTLSSFGSQGMEGVSPLWKQTCRDLLPLLPSAYLKCALTFLIADTGDYSAILEEQELKLTDRIAFACRYLSDEPLEMFLSTMSDSAKSSGTLLALVAEGFSNRGLDIVAAFVDSTTDVQTASIFCTKAQIISRNAKSGGKSPLFTDLRVQGWLESYRDLLDQWKLWTIRAKFDVACKPAEARSIPNQIFFRCTYCNKSVMVKASGSNVSRRSAPRKKVTACQCNKALPKCAICLLGLGTGTNRGSTNKSTRNKSDLNRGIVLETKTQSFSSWFSWCQICQHGGHAGCVEGWFENHTECPVPDCNCKCPLRQKDATHETLETKTK